MRNVWIIAAREFRHYFISPLAYAIAGGIFLILGTLFFINIFFGMQSGQISPDGRMVIGPLVTILVFVTPALTMRLLADEQRMGTMELLLTSPVRDWELVVGKWLGSLGFLAAILAVTWVYPLILHLMTEPGIDQGVLVSAYVGLVLLVSAMLALGVMVSSMFENLFAAFFLTFVLILMLWIVGSLDIGAGVASQVAGYLGLVDHYYDNLYRGVLHLSDVVYFVSLTVLSLFLGTQIIQARRWR